MDKTMQDQIILAIKDRKALLDGNQAQTAQFLGVSASQLSRVLKAEPDCHVISDAKWKLMAQKLGLRLHQNQELKLVKTPVFNYGMSILENFQANSVSGIWCDANDIGKTRTARHYSQTMQHAAYIDCSQPQTLRQFYQTIANQFGIGSNGSLANLYEDLTFYINTLPSPIIILDEAGYILKRNWILNVQGFWNAFDGKCSFVFIGADGFKALFEKGVEDNRVGYGELFSRAGRKYCSITRPDNWADDKQRALMTDVKKVASLTATAIIKGNAPDRNHNVLLNQVRGDDGRPSLRRIKTALSKQEE